MPLPPPPPPPYDWMPFTQRLLRASPVHPVYAAGAVMLVAWIAFTVMLVAIRGEPGETVGETFAREIASGFWFDYLVMALLAYVFGAADLMRRHVERTLVRVRPSLEMSDAAFAEASRHVLAFERGSRNVVGIAAVVVVIATGGGLGALAKFDIVTAGDHVLAGVIYLRIAVLLWGSATLLHDEFVALRRLSELARRHLKADLLNPTPLTPIGRVGLAPTLFMTVGISLAMPLLSDRDWTLATSAYLAFIAAGALALLVLPAIGAHDAIAREKRKELDRLDAMIAGHPGRNGGNREAAAELGGLVALRGALEDAREWPFSAPTLLRWLLFVSLPVVSWLGGALVERLVDAALG